VLREDTEWIENVQVGASILVGHDMTRIRAAFEHFKSTEPSFPQIYGDGHAAEFILDKLKDWLEK
jgi:UDP-GlcNAc3NAcA epimerase